MKKLLSISIAALMTIGLTNVFVPQQVNSEESSPKVVYTDTWTTSYFIDDDTETLYPYIECEAKIFDDGTLRITFGNTHKWEDTDDKKHYVTIVGSSPIAEHPYIKEEIWKPTMETSKYYPVNEEFEDENGILHYNGKIARGTSYAYGYFKEIDSLPNKDFSFWKSLDISYYPIEFSNATSQGAFNGNAYVGIEYIQCIEDIYGTNNKLSVGLLKSWFYEGKLSELPTDKKQTINIKPWSETYTKNSYNFRYFSHDITMTPEMFGAKSEPTTAPTQSNADKIKELEAQVKTLTEENEKLKSRNVFDLNDDGKVNVLDLITLKNYLLGI